MVGLHIVPDTSRFASARQLTLTHQSSMREKLFEYRFLTELCTELMMRGIEYEVLRGDIDKDGWDVLVQAGGIMRHIQLKVMVANGTRADVSVNTKLTAKPSGCIVWLNYDAAARDFSGIRWFGAAPGECLPNLGDKMAKHSRGNARGIKGFRPSHRILPARTFRKVEDFAQLADLLFGMQPCEPGAFLLSRMDFHVAGPAWLDRLRGGDLAAIPADLGWEGSGILAELIDGYRMAALAGIDDTAQFLVEQEEQARSTGDWPGDPIALWITLFLQHRAWYFSDGFGPDRDQTVLLDRLVEQLRSTLAVIA